MKKTAKELTAIKTAIRSNFLFQYLDEQQRNDVFSVMKKMQVSSGHVVITQGDEGDTFFVVESGEFDVWVMKDGSSKMDPSDVKKGALKVLTYKSSACFGELALMHNKPRAASVVAKTKGSFYVTFTSPLVLFLLSHFGFGSIVTSLTFLVVLFLLSYF